MRVFLEAPEGVLEALRGAVEVEVCEYKDKMAPRTPQERTSLRIAERMDTPHLGLLIHWKSQQHQETET